MLLFLVPFMKRLLLLTSVRQIVYWLVICKKVLSFEGVLIWLLVRFYVYHWVHSLDVKGSAEVLRIEEIVFVASHAQLFLYLFKLFLLKLIQRGLNLLQKQVTVALIYCHLLVLLCWIMLLLLKILVAFILSFQYATISFGTLCHTLWDDSLLLLSLHEYFRLFLLQLQNTSQTLWIALPRLVQLVEIFHADLSQTLLVGDYLH